MLDILPPQELLTNKILTEDTTTVEDVESFVSGMNTDYSAVLTKGEVVGYLVENFLFRVLDPDMTEQDIVDDDIVEDYENDYRDELFDDFDPLKASLTPGNIARLDDGRHRRKAQVNLWVASDKRHRESGAYGEVLVKPAGLWLQHRRLAACNKSQVGIKVGRMFDWLGAHFERTKPSDQLTIAQTLPLGVSGIEDEIIETLDNDAELLREFQEWAVMALYIWGDKHLTPEQLAEYIQYTKTVAPDILRTTTKFASNVAGQNALSITQAGDMHLYLPNEHALQREIKQRVEAGEPVDIKHFAETGSFEPPRKGRPPGRKGGTGGGGGGGKSGKGGNGNGGGGHHGRGARGTTAENGAEFALRSLAAVTEEDVDSLATARAEAVARGIGRQATRIAALADVDISAADDFEAGKAPPAEVDGLTEAELADLYEAMPMKARAELYVQYAMGTHSVDKLPPLDTNFASAVRAALTNENATHFPKARVKRALKIASGYEHIA